MNDYNFDSIVYDEPKYATVLFNSYAAIKSVILPSLLKSLFFFLRYQSKLYFAKYWETHKIIWQFKQISSKRRLVEPP